MSAADSENGKIGRECFLSVFLGAENLVLQGICFIAAESENGKTGRACFFLNFFRGGKFVQGIQKFNFMPTYKFLTFHIFRHGILIGGYSQHISLYLRTIFSPL